MDFLMCLTAAALLFLAYPYLRIAFKRLSLAVRIRKTAKKYGLTFFPASKNWLFGGLDGENCDFYLWGEKETLSVKLAAAKLRRSEYIFEGGKLRIKRYVVLSGGWAIPAPMLSGVKLYPEFFCNFRYRMPDELLDKPRRDILLFSPAPFSASTEDGCRFSAMGAKEFFNLCVRL